MRGGDFNLVLQSLIKPGSRVKKGQVIAEFDRQYMLLRLDDFRASQVDLDTQLNTLKTSLEVEKKAERQSIDSSKAALDKAKLDLKTIPVQAANTSERLKLSAEEAEASYKQLLNRVKYADASRVSEYRIAQLERNQQDVELKRSEANADRMLIKAPMDGVTVMGVTFRGGDFGQIQAGDQLHPGQMYMKVVDLSSMVIEASVNQVDVEEIRVGQKARVRFDAYPDLALPATVHAIGAISKNVGAGFRASFVREVPVVLKLDRLEARVIPDLSVSVDVVLDSQPGAILAPLQAIFQEGGKQMVFVQGPDGWVRREVELGPRNNLVAAIRSGLRPGEVIAAEHPVEPSRK